MCYATRQQQKANQHWNAVLYVSIYVENINSTSVWKHRRFYQGDSLSSCQGLHSWVLSSVWLSCCIGIEFGWHGKRQRWLWFNWTTVTDIIARLHYFMSATVWWWFRLSWIWQIHLMTVKHASLFNSSCSSLSGYFNELIQLTVFVFTFIRTAVTGIFSQKE